MMPSGGKEGFCQILGYFVVFFLTRARYVKFIYFRLMLYANDPYVIKTNCNFLMTQTLKETR